MASKTILTDDLGGNGEATTVEFAFKGIKYTIDLNAENLNDFEEEMKQYIENGRVKGGSTSTRRPVEESNAIRAWAEANGFTVAPKGRIPQAVLDAYEASAHPAEEAPVAAEAPAKSGRSTKKAGA